MSDDEFFAGLGFEVVNLDGKLVLVDKDLGPVFLSWFDSPLGIEHLDVRVPVLLSVPSKPPALLSLLERQGSFTVGQWIFAGDETQGYNLTFGVQLSRGDITAKVITSTLDFLKSAHAVGGQAMEEIAQNPSEFPHFSGAKFVRSMEAHPRHDDSESPPIK